MLRLEKIPFRTMKEITDGLRTALADHGVTLDSGCQLARAMAQCGTIVDAHEGRADVDALDVRKVLRDGTAAAYLASVTQAALARKLVQNVEQHVGALGKGEPLFHYKYPQSNDRDRAFELLVACCSAQWATAVRLGNDAAGEVDVLASFTGADWAIECKQVYENTADGGVARSIKKGIKQIHKSGRRGVVVLNVTNRLPHDDAWPSRPDGIEGSFKSMELAVRWYEIAFHKVLNDLGLLDPQGRLRGAIAAYAEQRNALNFRAVHTIFNSVCVVTRVPTVIAMLHAAPMPWAARQDDPHLELAGALNDSLQRGLYAEECFEVSRWEP